MPCAINFNFSGDEYYEEDFGNFTESNDSAFDGSRDHRILNNGTGSGSVRSLFIIELYESVLFYVNGLAIPSVLFVGAVGNSLSLAIGHRYGKWRDMSSLEKSAMAGLVALAGSDLMFCLIGLPELLFRRSTYQGAFTEISGVWDAAAFGYRIYKEPLHNLFLFTSTWIIVIISAERCLAVNSPIRARWYIRARKAVFVYVFVFLLAFVVCLPLFLKYQLVVEPCQSECVCAYVILTSLYRNVTFKKCYNIIWLTAGTFVPLCFLLVTTTRLVRVLHHRRLRHNAIHVEKFRYSRVTLTIIATIVTFFLLVCPSIVLESVGLAVGMGNLTADEVDIYRIAVQATNLTQAVKMSCNFIFYCSFIRQFQRPVQMIVSCCCCNGDRKNSCSPSRADASYNYRMRAYSSRRLTGCRTNSQFLEGKLSTYTINVI